MDIQWPLVFYTLFTSLGVGAFAFVAITEWLGKAERTRMPIAITALVALAAGGIASLFHLSHIERVFNVLGNLSSGISQEMILTGLTGLAILIYIIMIARGSSMGARKTVAIIGFVLAVLLGIRMGANYVLPARPAWNTFLLPLIYVVSAAVLGLFIAYVWASREGEDHVRNVNKAALIALAIQAVVFIGFLIYLAVVLPQHPLRSPARLFAGDMSLAFWLGVVVLGLVVPVVLTTWSQVVKGKVSSIMVATVGLICVLVGGVAFRAIMYMLGSSIEQFL